MSRPSIQEVILRHINDKVPRDPTFRALLAHPDWRVPRAMGSSEPTIILTKPDEPPTIWAFSTEEACRAAVNTLHAEAIGPVAVVPWLDDVLVTEDPRVQRLIIDPSSSIAFSIQTDALALFRKLARAVRVERAMAQRDHVAIRAYGAYLVPYFGVLGQGHNLITVPSERGNLIAAFTAHDQIEAFLAAGSDDERGRVAFASVDGAQLFGAALSVGAAGVLINAAGERPFGFELAACKDIARGSP